MKRWLSLVACVVLASACGGSDVAAPPRTTIGLWELRTVDGKPLPVRLLASSGASCGVDVMGGQFNFNQDGTYTGRIDFGTVIAGVTYCAASYVQNGTYTESGRTITLHASTGHVRAVVIEAGVLTESVSGHAYRYH